MNLRRVVALSGLGFGDGDRRHRAVPGRFRRSRCIRWTGHRDSSPGANPDRPTGVAQ